MATTLTCTDLRCQSYGLSMSVLRQRWQDDKQDIWDSDCRCDWGMTELLKSLTPSVGWGAGGLIRTSCHCRCPWWQRWGWAAESERSGTSWQSDPGPVAAALAMQPVFVSLGDRPGPPWLSAWINSWWKKGQPEDSFVDYCGHLASFPDWNWPWNLQ